MDTGLTWTTIKVLHLVLHVCPRLNNAYFLIWIIQIGKWCWWSVKHKVFIEVRKTSWIFLFNPILMHDDSNVWHTNGQAKARWLKNSTQTCYNMLSLHCQCIDNLFYGLLTSERYCLWKVISPRIVNVSSVFCLMPLQVSSAKGTISQKEGNILERNSH